MEFSPMASNLAAVDGRILSRMEEAAAIRAGSIIARGASAKPQAGGMEFEYGYLSPYFITDPERMEVAFENAYILIHEKKINSRQDLLPLMGRSHRVANRCSSSQRMLRARRWPLWS